MKLGKNQQKWIDALRSGKFKKGVGHLNQDNYFCCLGVACEIFKDELNLDIKVKEYPPSFTKRSVSITNYATNNYSAPMDIVQHLGLHSPMGDSNDYLLDSLTNLNDVKFEDDEDFNRIADYIEKNAQHYFKESR